MKSEKATLKAWNEDYKNYSDSKFTYAAINGDVKVLNSSQIRQRAKNVIQKQPHNRKLHSKMTRLIHQTQKNPYLHRVANAWTLGAASRGINTKTKSVWNKNDELRTAGRGYLLHKFAEKFNSLAPHEQIINAKQAHVSIHDGGNKIGEAKYLRYPKVKNQDYYNDTHNNRYNSGLKDTIYYVTHNYPMKAQYLVKNFKHQLKHFDNSIQYTQYYRNMKSAHRTAKRRGISLKQGYAERFGVGNDRIDVGPTVPIVTPYEDGLSKFDKAKSFMKKMDKQRQQNKLKNVLPSRKHAFKPHSQQHKAKKLHTKQIKRNPLQTHQGRIKQRGGFSIN